MKQIAFYISDYGHGHAARNIAVIRELLAHGPADIHITICTSFGLDFMKRSLEHHPEAWRLTFRRVTNDFGFVLQPNSVMPDIDRFTATYNEYIDQADAYVQQEKGFLQTHEIDLVVSDIAPFIFPAALELSIPSVGLSNFTWYTAYQDFFPINALEPLREAYALMDFFIKVRPAGTDEPEWGRKKTFNAGFYSRAFASDKVAKIRRMLDPSGQKTIVYFGLGMKIDVGELSAYPIWDSPNCVFIVSSNTEVARGNVTKIPADDTETQHYVAAADVVISKPGWSTVSEAVRGRSPLLIINRSNMREDQNTIAFLKRHNRCAVIEWDAVPELEITPDLVATLKQQDLESLYHEDELAKVARLLVSLLPE